MTGFRQSFERLYLQMDRRVLGVFRIGLGGTLVYDLVRRFPDAALLWSSDGVLTNASLRKVPQAVPQTSFLLGITSGSGVQLAFALLGLVFLLYGLGLFTRAMQLLSLLGYASLNARNLFFEDGGTGCTILLLSWTLLLPLGDRYSLDALRRDAGLGSLRARVRARAALQRPVVTLAALALLLQAAVIYWLNAVHKSGHTWQNGDAVHLVLWQHRVNTPFALWLAAHEPTWFSPLSTVATKKLELILPLLLLWPSHIKTTRSAAFVFAVLLHGGIALTLTLGPFSYVMMCLLWLAVPGEALDELRRFAVTRRLGARVARYRARAIRVLARGGAAFRARPWTLPEPWPRRGRLMRELVLGYMVLVEGANILGSNRAVPEALRVRPPRILRGYKPYLRATQTWSMFAPNAPSEDGTMVVDAVTRSGQHIDPLTGRAPDFDGIRHGLVPHSIALSDYLVAMRDPKHRRYRLDLARYFRALPGGNQLVSADFWWVSYMPPRRGSYEPGPLRKEKLWHASLAR